MSDRIYTHAEIAAELGISRGRVMQIEHIALQKLGLVLRRKGVRSVEDIVPDDQTVPDDYPVLRRPRK